MKGSSWAKALGDAGLELKRAAGNMLGGPMYWLSANTGLYVTSLVDNGARALRL